VAVETKKKKRLVIMMTTTTTAYGNTSDQNERYTKYFSGTSSDSPFVAAAATNIQGIALQRFGSLLNPLERQNKKKTKWKKKEYSASSCLKSDHKKKDTTQVIPIF